MKDYMDGLPHNSNLSIILHEIMGHNIEYVKWYDWIDKFI